VERTIEPGSQEDGRLKRKDLNQETGQRRHTGCLRGINAFFLKGAIQDKIEM